MTGTVKMLSAADTPSALLQETFPDSPDRWWRFRDPVRLVEVHDLAGVLPALEDVERAVDSGLHAVGFVAYEAAPAFDVALEAKTPGPLPLTWWGLFEAPERAEAPIPFGEALLAEIDWRPLVDRSAYEDAIARIRGAIAAGDTYQVNYTFPLEARFQGDAFALFAALVRAQRPPGTREDLVRGAGHAAYVDTGRFAVCSASPELFFTLEGERIVARPMKGTARRGRDLAEDRRRSAALSASAKDRAENVMIVDMVRNDLARIASPGSVAAEDLCRVETYPTVHQLTSTVAAHTRASVTEILRSLFPSASITGAPKIATARIIRALEAAPRGVYTGTVGHLAPGRRAHFNVAIRTATVDRSAGRVCYGTGGGIVWDSDADAEYEECRTKALVLKPGSPSFELLETLVWRPHSGYFLLGRHLGRMAASASYFGYPWSEEEVRRRLVEAAAGFAGARTRVRLTLDRDGRLSLEARRIPRTGRTEWTIGLAATPVDSSDVFLFHKTTHRRIYEEALGRRGDCDEVVLWNERGELTEATRANLVLEVDGEYLSPPVASGLLAGTYRAELLSRGRIREAVLPVEALGEADRILLTNSVRGFIRAHLRLAEALRPAVSDRMAGS